MVTATSAIASLFILYPEYLVSFAKSLISAPLFAANFYFWSERGYFGELAELKPLIHLWSLAVEEQFYIFFPLFLLLFKQCKNLFYGLFTLIFVVSLASSYYVTELHFDTAFYFPVTRAWELLTGAIAALILRKEMFNFKTSTADFISCFGLLLITYSYLYFNKETPFPSITAAIPVLGTFLFIITASQSSFINRVFSAKPIVFIGLTSFSLYLWHQPIFAFARHLTVFEGNTIFLIGLTVILSYLSYQYVEKPFRNRTLISAKRIFFFSIFVGISLIVTGYIYLINKGFPDRYPVEDRAVLTQLSHYKGYNQKAFNDLQFRQFGNPNKRHIVLIGDSYAKDLLNIINESNLFADVEFSTRQVNSECGNLYLEDYKDIQRFIPKNRLERCKVLGRYDGEDFQNILNNADEIWLAAKWREWVIEHLPESINNLSNKYAKPIRIFGIKSFGDIKPYKLLDIPHQLRKQYKHSVEQVTKIRSQMLHDAFKDYDLFYPLLNPLCGGNSSECRIFTDNGLLMSADGEHLTREGAMEAANQLNETLNKIYASLTK